MEYFQNTGKYLLAEYLVFLKGTKNLKNMIHLKDYFKCKNIRILNDKLEKLSVTITSSKGLTSDVTIAEFSGFFFYLLKYKD